MTRIRSALLPLLPLLVALAALRAGGPTPLMAQQPGGLSCSWTGTWDTGEFGVLKLTQSGSQVSGSYSYSQGRANSAVQGRLSGVAQGTVLSGAWQQSPSYTGRDSGSFIFTLAPGCSQFYGQWRLSTTAAGSWDGYWNGNLIAAAPNPAYPNCAWTGAWDTGQYGQLTLTQSGSQVSGSYSYGDGRSGAFFQGTVLGSVQGSTLSGVWRQSPTYVGQDTGSFLFTMAPTCAVFLGQWRSSTTAAGTWDGYWNGTLITAASDTRYPNCSWTGIWQTGQYGTLALVQTGSQVSGMYSYSDGRSGNLVQGTLLGMVQGSTLSGSWRQSPTYAGQDTGSFLFTAAPSCTAFLGQWRYSTTPAGSWDGPWNGNLSGG